MATTTYREALRIAHKEALRKDPRVFLMGEDVGKYGGSYAVSKGLLAEFGPERIRDTPLSESTFVGAGIGAALCWRSTRSSTTRRRSATCRAGNSASPW
jgi:pyruvate dehydrogenase E1 component beta subunit